MRCKFIQPGIPIIALVIFLSSVASLQAQTTSVVKGKVQNNAGDPLAGVSVVVRNVKDNFTAGTSTDSAGNFTFARIAPGGPYTFTFTSVGYDAQNYSGYTIQPGVTLSLSVKLLESANAALDQVVVVGYGTKRKRDLTGAVSSVTGADLQKSPSSNFTAAMQGKVPGVFISQTSGAPGGASTVRIRGVGTTGNNQPLYVVDGVLMGGDGMNVPGSSYSIDPLSIINPNDIESVDVLKDAASAAIYGSRGANGVILVTTKRGKEGGGTVTFNASTGFAQLWRKPAFLNAEEFATMANELYRNSGLTPNPEWADPKSFGKGTDMINEVFRSAPLQNYDVSVSGGTKNLKARLSLGYNDQKGTMIETYYKRYTGRATVDLKVGSKLNFGGSLAFASTESKGQNSDAMQGGIFNLAQQFFPTLHRDSAYFGDGVYYTKDGDNPILRARTIDNHLYNSRIYGNVFGELELLPGLKFRSSLGIDGNFNRTRSWQGKLQRGFYVRPRATLNERFDNNFNWLLDNTLSYSKRINGHSINVVLGQTSQKFRNNWIAANGNEYLSEQLQVINASDVSLRTTSGSNSNSTLASYFGRVDYSLNGTYLLSASLRRDGSSNFGPNNKWGYFPAVSAGWRISEEKFMEPLLDVVSDFKLRGSWGRVGNDNIPAFGYMSTIRSGNSADNYPLGPGDQTINIGSTILRPGNPDLKWETTEQIDIGADVSFFEDKLYLTADYYKKSTIGMLISLPVSLEAGFQNPPTINGGRVENKGWEFALGYRNTINDVRFNISGNIATLSNQVTSLGVGQPIVGDALPGSSMRMTYTKQGEPIGYFRGYVVDGVYQTDAEVNKGFQPNAIAGDFIYRDVNNDGALTDADKIKIGKPWPDFTYGINADVSYKGFDLNIMFQGVSGSQIYRANKITNYQMKYYNGNGIINGVKDVLNHWTPGSGVNDQPGLKFTDANGNYSNASSFFVEDGDFLRLRNIVLGYNVPGGALNRVGGNVFKSVRVYLTAQNLFTFTKYKGFDPEIGSTNPMNSGIDTGVYPQPRTFSAGVSLTF